MTQQEHLQRIRQRCVELLEIAEKRTAGVWKHNHGRRMLISVDSLHEDAVLHGDEFEICDYDASFIASCAGAAEAGWKATIATIDGLDQLRRHYGPINIMLMAFMDEQEEAIIAAWPEELL
jgi:hypothetical protein